MAVLVAQVLQVAKCPPQEGPALRLLSRPPVAASSKPNVKTPRPIAGASLLFPTSVGTSFSTPGTTGFVTPAPAGDEDCPTLPSGEPSVLEGDADKDWTTLEVIDKAQIYKTNDQGKFVKHCGGKFKFQEHNNTQSRRLIMRNEASGKVMLNSSISKGLPVQVYDLVKSKRHGGEIEGAQFFCSLNSDKPPERVVIRRRFLSGKTPLGEILKKMYA